MDALTLLTVMRANRRGFTVRFDDPTDSPDSGFAVTVGGTETLVADSITSVRRFLNWLSVRDVAVEYVGGWRRPDGTFEMNATVVFDREDEALAAARTWNQMSVWHLDEGTGIDTGLPDGSDNPTDLRAGDTPAVRAGFARHAALAAVYATREDTPPATERHLRLLD